MGEQSQLESKIQALEKQKQKVATRLKQEKARLRAQAGRARKQRLYEVGELAKRAQLLDVDDEVLLGAMVEVKALLEDEPTCQILQRAGATLMLRQAHLPALT